MNAPSPIGPIGGRTSSGRFAPGNPGGPGNPFAQRVARLRSALLESVTDDDLKAIVQAVVGRPRRPTWLLVRVIFDYCVGKPLPAPDPDRADLVIEQQVHQPFRRNEVFTKDARANELRFPYATASWRIPVATQNR